MAREEFRRGMAERETDDSMPTAAAICAVTSGALPLAASHEL
jgi:hypothetical protein